MSWESVGQQMAHIANVEIAYANDQTGGERKQCEP